MTPIPNDLEIINSYLSVLTSLRIISYKKGELCLLFEEMNGGYFEDFSVSMIFAGVNAMHFRHFSQENQFAFRSLCPTEAANLKDPMYHPKPDNGPDSHWCYNLVVDGEPSDFYIEAQKMAASYSPDSWEKFPVGPLLDGEAELIFGPF